MNIMMFLQSSSTILSDIVSSSQGILADVSMTVGNADAAISVVKQGFDMDVVNVIIHILLAIGIAMMTWILMLIPRFKHPRPFDTLVKYKYAHRGLHDSVIPENSFSAFKAAMDAGYASELDVMLSADGRLVIMHDYSLKRMCGIDKKVLECTSDELDQLRLLDTDEKIPYLEEVLDLVDGKMPLLIEIKATVKDCFTLMEKTFEILDNYKGDYCIESFDPRVLLWLKWYRPNVVRGQLSGYINKHGQKLFFLGDFALSFLLVNCVGSPDFIAYRYDDRKNPSIRLCRSLFNPKTFYWTITNEKDRQDVEKDGSVIIFEDFKPPVE